MMLTATLGGLIKDYRIKKRLSQFEISLRIGWKDASRLSKIEQGRVGKPTRETIEKIIKALELSEQERSEFLLTGSYLPSNEEIKNAIKKIGPKILNWPYPAYLMDFSWRILLMNQPTIDVFGFPPELFKKVSKLKPNLLENVISPWEMEIFKGDDKNSLKPFNETLVAQFKFEHIGQENERWYKQLVLKLADNESFRNLWSKIQSTDYHKKLSEYEYKEVRWPKSRKVIRYHVFDSKLVFDRRFTATLYLESKI